MTGVAIVGAAEAQWGKALPGLSAGDVMAEASPSTRRSAQRVRWSSMQSVPSSVVVKPARRAAVPSCEGDPRSRSAAIAASAALTFASSATKGSSRQTARTCSASQGPRASSAGTCACVIRSEGYAGGGLERAPADVYWDHCRKRELAYQVDTQGKPVFPPRVGDGLQWRVSAGRGVVHAVTVAHPRGEDEAYNIVLVDVDEGFRMMSTVQGAGPIVIGARVEVRWREGSGEDEAPVPVFAVVAS